MPNQIAERAFSNELKILPEPFQDKFLFSRARYPAFVSAWGTGKTMFGLLRGKILSEKIPNNLGLIVRNEFTDLKDSTIKDFERYTGMTVGSNKDVKFANGSIIMFRHGAELDVLKNINLGWFMMEQAEEFDNEEPFEFLRGRLRREGIPYHTGFIIANTNGHNWIWKLWKNNPPSKEYELTEATTFDNARNLPKDFIEDLKRMEIESPNHYKRYILNSWEDTEGDDYLFTYPMLEKSVALEFKQESRGRVIGLDIARFGDNETAFTVIDNKGLLQWEQSHIEGHRGKDTSWVSGRYIDLRRELSVKLGVLDDVGVGGGVVDSLKDSGQNIKSFISNAKPKDDVYYDMRAEGYFKLQEWISKGYLKIMNDPELIDQLLTIKFEYRKGKRAIVSKDKMRKDGIKSPDRTDALMMAVWGAGKSLNKAQPPILHAPKAH